MSNPLNKTWNRINHSAKASVLFRILSYYSALLIVFFHHLENDLPLSILDLFSFGVILSLPFLFLAEYGLKKNEHAVMMRQMTYDFVGAGWIAGLLNFSVIPSLVYIFCATLNQIASKGFKKIHLLLLVPVGAIVPFLLSDQLIIPDSGGLVQILSLSYFSIHIIVLAYISYLYSKEAYHNKIQVERQQEEITVQSEELRALNDVLIDLNHNLEETVADRTKELEIKNEKLAEYAFINAHKLRAPISTLQGLLSLIDKDKANQEQIIEKIKESIEVLVLIVTDIRITLERDHESDNPLKDNDQSIG